MKNEVREVTNTQSEYAEFLLQDDLRCLLKTWRVSPNNLTIKVGGLEVLQEGPQVNGSVVRVNGIELSVKALHLSGEVDGGWLATIEFYPGLVGKYQGG